MLLSPPRSWERSLRRGAGATASRTCKHTLAWPASLDWPARRAARPKRSHAALVAASSPPSSLTAPAASDLLERLAGSIVVVGAGPAGLAMAVALQRVGLPAVVVERETELSTGGTALGLWTNAWRALEALGAAEPLRAQHPLVDTVELCRSTGHRLRSFSLDQCDGGPHEFRGVRRAALLRVLADRLAPGTLLLGCPVTGVESQAQGAALRLAGGQRAECLAVVGADGGRSAAAAAVGRAPPRYVGQSAIRGVAVYPEGVPCGVIRQVWGQGPRAGMYPISDTELYWFVCFDAPAEAPAPATPEGVREEALRLVAGWEWAVPEVVQRTPLESFVRSRIADRWDLPSSSSDCLVTLAGDALHPMTPNLGQGGCTALEDAVVLARLLRDRGVPALLQRQQGSGGGSGGGREEAARAVGEAFREYERERARRCLPITVRSFGMGALLQLPLVPVVAARDLFVERLFSPAHFLDHATFDCGRLE